MGLVLLSIKKSQTILSISFLLLPTLIMLNTFLYSDLIEQLNTVKRFALKKNPWKIYVYHRLL